MFTQEELAYTPTLLKEKSRSYRKLMQYNNSLYGDISNEPLTMIAQSTVLKNFSKPNLSLNNDYNYIVLPLIDLDKNNAKVFKKISNQLEFKVPNDKIRNTASGIHQLFLDSYPESYIRLKSFLFELNMKMQLINALIDLGTPEKIIEKAKQGISVYSSHYDESIPFIKNKQFCYKGIIEAKTGISCLRVIDQN